MRNPFRRRKKGIFEGKIEAVKTQKPKPKKYSFEIVILDSINKHYVYTRKSMNHTFMDPAGKLHKITPEDLYLIKPKFMHRLKLKLSGIDSAFMAVFKKNSQDPVEYENPLYSARVIKTIEESQALKTALKDEFAKAMDAKMLFMYFVLICGLLVVYLVLTGQIRI